MLVHAGYQFYVSVRRYRVPTAPLFMGVLIIRIAYTRRPDTGVVLQYAFAVLRLWPFPAVERVTGALRGTCHFRTMYNYKGSTSDIESGR